MIPRTKVFVGSLPPGSKPEELRRLFENYGIVTECDIMNRCGFVHMETQEMAENAIRALNNTVFRGTNITVEPGRMKDRNANSGGRQRNSGRMNNDGGNRKLFGGGGRVGGPTRHDHGGHQRNRGPYNRTGGNAFDRWQGGQKSGGNRLDMDHPSINFNGNSNMGSMGGDRYNNNNFGMGNQDRRGFALPERQMFCDNLGMDQFNSNKGSGYGGNLGGFGGNNPSFGGNNGNFGGGNTRGFGGRQGGFNNNDMFSRRSSSGMGSNTLMNDRSFERNQMGSGNYNQSFPPLSGRGNRNGPSRRDMMSNRRY